MYILGIHDGHNSAVSLLKDGEIISATQPKKNIHRCSRFY